MTIKWVLSGSLGLINSKRSKSFTGLNKFLALECLLNIFESLTVEHAFRLHELVHFVELSQFLHLINLLRALVLWIG